MDSGAPIWYNNKKSCRCYDQWGNILQFGFCRGPVFALGGDDMSDLVWFVIVGVMFVLLGLLFLVLGWLIWKKQKMNLIIIYHCDKVSEENRQAYCTLAGVGVFTIGVGFGLSGIATVLLQSVYAFIPMTIGLAAGVALLLWAIVRYNR